MAAGKVNEEDGKDFSEWNTKDEEETPANQILIRTKPRLTNANIKAINAFMRNNGASFPLGVSRTNYYYSLWNVTRDFPLTELYDMFRQFPAGNYVINSFFDGDDKPHTEIIEGSLLNIPEERGTYVYQILIKIKAALSSTQTRRIPRFMAYHGGSTPGDERRSDQYYSLWDVPRDFPVDEFYDLFRTEFPTGRYTIISLVTVHTENIEVAPTQSY